MISARVFSSVRIATGIYAIWFFTNLLFLPQQILFWPAAHYFSDLGLIIGSFTTQWPLYLVIAIGAISGACLALGWNRRTASAIQWLMLTLVLAQAPLLFEVHHDYWSWLLILFVLLPPGEPRSPLHRLESSWQVSRSFYQAYWISLGASYSLSGVSKLASEWWQSGEILRSYFGAMSWAYYDMNPLLASLPLSAHRAFSAVVAWPEAFALPLVLSSKTRGWIWLVLTLGQVQMVLFSQINHISIMMVIFSVLGFDPQWIPNLRRKALWKSA